MATSSTPSPRLHGVDAADEAGGEVIFSSDGVVLEVPPPPVRNVEQVYASELVEETTEAALRRQQALLQSLQDGSTGAIHGNEQESTAQRLERLSREISQVEHDVQEEQALKSQVAVLKQRLQAQQDSLQRRMDELPISATIERPTGPANGHDLEAFLLRLENAVAAINSNSNTSTTTTTTSKSLLQRLVQLETHCNNSMLLDDSKLAAAALKAKVLRQDLEAASKARNKLVSSTSTSTRSTSATGTTTAPGEDAKTLTALYDSMTELSQFSTHLPALVQRLQVLSRQHMDAASYASRLQAAEDAVATLQRQVQNVEQGVATVQSSWKDNAQVLAQNMRDLDERMKLLQ